MVITRTIALTLLCASAWSLTPIAPLQPAGDSSDCALYLNGPGRTSAYDYSINLLKGNFGYEGQSNCITYEAINQAYLEARNRILVSQPKGDWKAEDFASVGELILDISINLARRYGLTYEEIEKGLPLIDTSRTLIREVCPPVFSHVECRAGKYRRLDGLCNNLQHPTWGATMAPFQRLIGPLFADGINAPRIAHHGRDLPLSRVVSRTMHPDDGFHDHAGTVMVIAWGQFMDHDYTLTATPLDPINRNDPEECCKRPPHLKHPYCNEIRIPDDDYFYRLFGVKCIDFVRGFPSPRPGCRLGSRNPFNTLTGVIDGNTVYGVTEKFARKLRTGFGGLLRMNPVFKEYGLKDLLPLKLDIPDEGCTRPNKNMYCFEAGEIRVNEQLVLTVMHTLMAREHNRVANALAEVNPHWDDETLFQEARRINIAEIQHITYNEFLPILLGKDVMEKFGLVLEKEGYWDGYDPEVNPDVIASFAAAAYRFGHSLLPTAVERWSKAHKFIASKRLSDLIRRPYDLYRAGVLDEYVMGLMNQVAQAMDDSITQEVTNHLFKKVGARFGMDLVSFNMQRGREFGIPGYMEFRKFCGLPPADTFQDLFGSMPNQTVQKYETIFDHPIDVDLWSGGVSERPLPGSMLGPTFACIIATQFSYSRRGDRFWFELPNQPSSFTPEQLAEIRKARLARVICDNTDIIDTVQLYPMVLPDHELNPRVPCRSGIIPQMDFSKWAEPAPFHGAAKQFMTHADIIENNTTKHTNLTNEGQDCNKTEITETLTQNPGLILLQVQNANNTIKHITDSTPTHETFHETITNNLEKPIKINEITDKDTVLKYVYKKDDKTAIDNKHKGHPKNSLKRRKRSHDPLSPLPSKFQNPGLIVNYETSHAPTATSNWSPPSKLTNIKDTNLADFKIETHHNNADIQKNDHNDRSAKKDSSSEVDSSEVNSLNEDSNENTNRKYKQNDSAEDTSRESDESKDYDLSKNQNYRSHNKNNDDSNENYSRNNEKYSTANDISKESSENYKNGNSEADSAENKERSESTETNYSSNEKPFEERPNTKESENYSPKADLYKSSPEDNLENSKENYNSDNKNSFEENKDSGEANDRRYSTNTKPYKSQNADDFESNKDNIRGQSTESNENSSENTKENYKQGSTFYKPSVRNDRTDNLQSYPIDNQEYSAEISTEDREKEQNIPRNSNNLKTDLKSPAKNKSLPLQDIELGDFSNERINLRENGKDITTKDNHENVDPNSAIEILPLNPKKTNAENHDILQLITNIHTPSKERTNKLININDGEVKPVVEIHTENDDDSSEENTKDNLSNSESLETILNGKESEIAYNDDQNGKIVIQKEPENGNVKQQFERIPLNYNHNQKNQLSSDTQSNDASKEEDHTKLDDGIKIENPPKEIDIAVTKPDGTIDVFAPEDVRYDENLNIKFDDLQLKLPEIRLPEDILQFTKSHSPYKDNDSNEDTKKSRYPYDHRDKDEPRRQKNNKHNYDDNKENDEAAPVYYGYYGEDREKNQDYKKEDAEEENDEDEDLYEKFVRERFGKRGTFEKRSERLQERPLNPQLTETIQNILKKTAVIDEQAKKSGDPNAGYMWTLEYGENL